MRQKQKTIFVFLLLVACVCTLQAQTEFWYVDVQQYEMALPSFMKMCKSNGHCYSTIVSQNGTRILQYQDNNVYTVWMMLPGGSIGVIRDNSGGATQCFGDSPGTCAATFPPGYAKNDYVPVLPTPAINTITPGGQLFLPVTAFFISVYDAACVPQYAGPDNSASQHFILASYDFGLPLGVVANVYVLESVSGIPVGATNPMNGQRLERYFFCPGLGRCREEGWLDSACNADPATCLGNYSVASPGATNWWPVSGQVPQLIETCP